jgi:hypothetical protein
MEAQLREVLGHELHRRHGYGMMEGKIKPVHIANSLLRQEHQLVGKMSDLKHLMAATASKETAEDRLDAARRMLERNRERWGRLGEDADLRRSTLMTRVLPLLRTILATDGAAFGKSPELSSFSSPTALTITRDPSDEQAGAFVHRLWSHAPRLRVLDILRTLTSVERPLSDVDDLTAVLIPLTDGTTPRPDRGEPELEPAPLTSVETCLRDAARDLAAYEDKVLPNPMATLQRIVLLASISVFVHAATRAHEVADIPRRVLLLDASNAKNTIAEVSEATVTTLFSGARAYMAHTLREMLAATEGTRRGRKRWMADPESAVAEMFKSRLGSKTPANLKEVVDALEEIEGGGADVEEELPVRLVSPPRRRRAGGASRVSFACSDFGADCCIRSRRTRTSASCPWIGPLRCWSRRPSISLVRPSSSGISWKNSTAAGGSWLAVASKTRASSPLPGPPSLAPTSRRTPSDS